MEGLSLYWTTAEAARGRQQRSIDPVGAWLGSGELTAAAPEDAAATAQPGAADDIAAEDALLPWLDCELRLTVVMGGEAECPGLWRCFDKYSESPALLPWVSMVGNTAGDQHGAHFDLISFIGRAAQAASMGAARLPQWAWRCWCSGWSCSCTPARRRLQRRLRMLRRCGGCAGATRRTARAAGAPSRARACPGGAWAAPPEKGSLQMTHKRVLHCLPAA